MFIELSATSNTLLRLAGVKGFARGEMDGKNREKNIDFQERRVFRQGQKGKTDCSAKACA
jgi:hypothetical protein